MKKYLGFFSISIMLVWNTACSTNGGIILHETPLSVSDTRKGIVSIIGEPRFVSENGRELFSKYYDKKDKEIIKLNMVRRRYSTHVIILGDRRPYDVEVKVLIEDRIDDTNFSVTDHDDEKAEIIAEKIKKALNQSRDGRNIIDDFRTF